MVETVVRLRLPVDLGLTLAPLRRAPVVRVERGGVWWRATRTPLGPALARYAAARGEVRVQAWGSGAEWCVATAPELLGARDSLEGFTPEGLVGRLHRRLAGLRIPRSRQVFECLVPTILEQKVAVVEARAAYRRMVLAWGEPAPGPVPLVVPPGPEVLASQPYWALHPFGVEMKRAGALREVARRAYHLDRTLAMPPAEARRLLGALPGVGPWTAAWVAQVALGDPDAVPLGDLHYPHLVSWALAGEPRGDDDRMLELLEPYAGHRGRVIRLLEAAGLRVPRRAPRAPLRSFRSC